MEVGLEAPAAVEDDPVVDTDAIVGVTLGYQNVILLALPAQ